MNAALRSACTRKMAAVERAAGQKDGKGTLMETKHLGIAVGIGNQKGGVGKTTTTVHLAAALGAMGYEVLVIDLDPGAGATRHLGVPENSFAGTLELLTDHETPQALAVTEKMPKGVHLIPSRGQLSELDTLLSKFADKTRVLDKALELARPDYDFILLDTPPWPSATTTVAAYSSAEWFILTAFPHALSVSGLNEAFKDIGDVRQNRNHRLEILGIAICCVDTRTKIAADVERVIAENVPGRKFRTLVSQAVALPKASERGKTLFQVPSFAKTAVAAQYRALAREVVARVQNRDAFLAGELYPGTPRMPQLEHVANE